MDKSAGNSSDVVTNEVLEVAKRARSAASVLAGSSEHQRNQALAFAIEELRSSASEIFRANEKDLQTGALMVEAGELSQANAWRLKLDNEKLETVLFGMEQIRSMPEPLGQTTLARELDEGLELYRITVAIGVVAVIFEARPDALPQIASLCLKSGNAVILKGGKEALETNRKLFAAIQRGVVKAGLPGDTLFLLESREAVSSLLNADRYVDLVVPRGSNELVRHIQDNTRIPVLGHADGLCHIYVDKKADIEKSVDVILDAKVSYPSACNSVETVLIHQACASTLLSILVPKLMAQGVEIRADKSTVEATPLPMRAGLQEALESDWSQEYCALILSIKIVDSIDEAIAHINEYGSHHTETILSTDPEALEKFFAQVNSAGVFWNASTRFADGYRYGFGAEVGISTGKLHPRGPVGLEGLVTYKYKVIGKGHIVADYSGENAKKFTHRTISA